MIETKDFKFRCPFCDKEVTCGMVFHRDTVQGDGGVPGIIERPIVRPDGAIIGGGHQASLDVATQMDIPFPEQEEYETYCFHCDMLLSECICVGNGYDEEVDYSEKLKESRKINREAKEIW